MIFFIITPSYNQLFFLKRCIASVADQVNDSVQVYHHIQDGNSTDGSIAYLEEYIESLCLKGNKSYIFSYESRNDRGMYDGLNFGLEYGSDFFDKKSIVSWLNCDEQYLDGTLQTVANVFGSNPNLDMLYGNTLNVNVAGEMLTYRKTLLYANYMLKLIIFISKVHLYFFQSSIFKNGLRFDTFHKAISDCILLTQILEQGKSAARLNQYLSIFTMTGKNLSIEDVGLKELKYWHDTAPAFIRLFRPIINGFRYFEKWLVGGYSERFPLKYSIYTDDMNARKLFVINSGSWKFTWGR